jgi:O-antigen ligase
MGLIALVAAYATQRRGGQAALWGVLAAIVGFVVIFMGSGTAERFLADDDAGGGRLIVYAAILENLSERPWLGQGAGAFHDTFRAYLPIEVARAEWHKAHNSYLENIWELGLPMAAVFYAAFVVVFLRLMRGLRVRMSDIGLPAAALAVMVTGGVHSVVDFSLQMPATAALFAVFLGIGWSQSFPRAERASVTRRKARNEI